VRAGRSNDDPALALEWAEVCSRVAEVVSRLEELSQQQRQALGQGRAISSRWQRHQRHQLREKVAPLVQSLE
jgi:hypothetical protein